MWEDDKMSLKFNIYMRWEDSRNSSFLSLLNYDTDAKAIDIGCGNGTFTFKAKEKIGCEDMLGIDGKETQLIKVRKKGVKTKRCVFDKKLPFRDNTYDIVISNQVLEHSLYPVKFIKEIYRILKPGGYAVISTENLSSWDNILALVLGYTPFSMEFDGNLSRIGNPLSLHDREVKEEKYPHVRVLAWTGLIEVMKFVGFEVENVVGSGHLLGRVGEKIDKKHARFITIKVRK